MRSVKTALCLVPLLLVATSHMVAQQQLDRLTLDLYLEWESVSDPRVSPDGEQVIYTRRWIDKMSDRWESSLWIMNVDGSGHPTGPGSHSCVRATPRALRSSSVGWTPKALQPR
jgi:Tol biopolymer transport system component